MLILKPINIGKTESEGKAWQQKKAKPCVTGCFFLESVADSYGLAGLLTYPFATLPSHAPMAAYSGLKCWAATYRLTAAGLCRTLTCFPFHTPRGVTKPGAKVQNKNNMAKTMFLRPFGELLAAQHLDDAVALDNAVGAAGGEPVVVGAVGA